MLPLGSKLTPNSLSIIQLPFGEATSFVTNIQPDSKPVTSDTFTHHGYGPVTLTPLQERNGQLLQINESLCLYYNTSGSGDLMFFDQQYSPQGFDMVAAQPCYITIKENCLMAMNNSNNTNKSHPINQNITYSYDTIYHPTSLTSQTPVKFMFSQNISTKTFEMKIPLDLHQVIPIHINTLSKWSLQTHSTHDFLQYIYLIRFKPHQSQNERLHATVSSFKKQYNWFFWSPAHGILDVNYQNHVLYNFLNEAQHITDASLLPRHLLKVPAKYNKLQQLSYYKQHQYQNHHVTSQFIDDVNNSAIMTDDEDNLPKTAQTSTTSHQAPMDESYVSLLLTTLNNNHVVIQFPLIITSSYTRLGTTTRETFIHLLKIPQYNTNQISTLNATIMYIRATPFIVTVTKTSQNGSQIEHAQSNDSTGDGGLDNNNLVDPLKYQNSLVRLLPNVYVNLIHLEYGLLVSTQLLLYNTVEYREEANELDTPTNRYLYYLDHFNTTLSDPRCGVDLSKYHIDVLCPTVIPNQDSCHAASLLTLKLVIYPQKDQKFLLPIATEYLTMLIQYTHIPSSLAPNLTQVLFDMSKSSFNPSNIDQQDHFINIENDEDSYLVPITSILHLDHHLETLANFNGNVRKARKDVETISNNGISVNNNSLINQQIKLTDRAELYAPQQNEYPSSIPVLAQPVVSYYKNAENSQEFIGLTRFVVKTSETMITTTNRDNSAVVDNKQAHLWCFLINLISNPQYNILNIMQQQQHHLQNQPQPTSVPHIASKQMTIKTDKHPLLNKPALLTTKSGEPYKTLLNVDSNPQQTTNNIDTTSTPQESRIDENVITNYLNTVTDEIITENQSNLHIQHQPLVTTYTHARLTLSWYQHLYAATTNLTIYTGQQNKYTYSSIHKQFSAQMQNVILSGLHPRLLVNMTVWYGFVGIGQLSRVFEILNDYYSPFDAILNHAHNSFPLNDPQRCRESAFAITSTLGLDRETYKYGDKLRLDLTSLHRQLILVLTIPFMPKKHIISFLMHASNNLVSKVNFTFSFLYYNVFNLYQEYITVLKKVHRMMKKSIASEESLREQYRRYNPTVMYDDDADEEHINTKLNRGEISTTTPTQHIIHQIQDVYELVSHKLQYAEIWLQAVEYIHEHSQYSDKISYFLLSQASCHGSLGHKTEVNFETMSKLSIVLFNLIKQTTLQKVMLISLLRYYYNTLSITEQEQMMSVYIFLVNSNEHSPLHAQTAGVEAGHVDFLSKIDPLTAQNSTTFGKSLKDGKNRATSLPPRPHELADKEETRFIHQYRRELFLHRGVRSFHPFYALQSFHRLSTNYTSLFSNTTLLQRQHEDREMLEFYNNINIYSNTATFSAIYPHYSDWDNISPEHESAVGRPPRPFPPKFCLEDLLSGFIQQVGTQYAYNGSCLADLAQSFGQEAPSNLNQKNNRAKTDASIFDFNPSANSMTPANESVEKYIQKYIKQNLILPHHATQDKMYYNFHFDLYMLVTLMWYFPYIHLNDLYDIFSTNKYYAEKAEKNYYFYHFNKNIIKVVYYSVKVDAAMRTILDLFEDVGTAPVCRINDDNKDEITRYVLSTISSYIELCTEIIATFSRDEINFFFKSQNTLFQPHLYEPIDEQHVKIEDIAPPKNTKSDKFNPTTHYKKQQSSIKKSNSLSLSNITLSLVFNSLLSLTTQFNILLTSYNNLVNHKFHLYFYDAETQQRNSDAHQRRLKLSQFKQKNLQHIMVPLFTFILPQLTPLVYTITSNSILYMYNITETSLHSLKTAQYDRNGNLNTTTHKQQKTDDEFFATDFYTAFQPLLLFIMTNNIHYIFSSLQLYTNNIIRVRRTHDPDIKSIYQVAYYIIVMCVLNNNYTGSYFYQLLSLININLPQYITSSLSATHTMNQNSPADIMYLHYFFNPYLNHTLSQPHISQSPQKQQHKSSRKSYKNAEFLMNDSSDDDKFSPTCLSLDSSDDDMSMFDMDDIFSRPKSLGTPKKTIKNGQAQHAIILGKVPYDPAEEPYNYDCVENLFFSTFIHVLLHANSQSVKSNVFLAFEATSSNEDSDNEMYGSEKEFKGLIIDREIYRYVQYFNTFKAFYGLSTYYVPPEVHEITVLDRSMHYNDYLYTDENDYGDETIFDQSFDLNATTLADTSFESAQDDPCNTTVGPSGEPMDLNMTVYIPSRISSNTIPTLCASEFNYNYNEQDTSIYLVQEKNININTDSGLPSHHPKSTSDFIPSQPFQTAETTPSSLLLSQQHTALPLSRIDWFLLLLQYSKNTNYTLYSNIDVKQVNIYITQLFTLLFEQNLVFFQILAQFSFTANEHDLSTDIDPLLSFTGNTVTVAQVKSPIKQKYNQMSASGGLQTLGTPRRANVTVNTLPHRTTTSIPHNTNQQYITALFATDSTISTGLQFTPQKAKQFQASTANRNFLNTGKKTTNTLPMTPFSKKPQSTLISTLPTNVSNSSTTNSVALLTSTPKSIKSASKTLNRLNLGLIDGQLSPTDANLLETAAMYQYYNLISPHYNDLYNSFLALYNIGKSSSSFTCSKMYPKFFNEHYAQLYAAENNLAADGLFNAVLPQFFANTTYQKNSRHGVEFLTILTQSVDNENFHRPDIIQRYSQFVQFADNCLPYTTSLITSIEPEGIIQQLKKTLSIYNLSLFTSQLLKKKDPAVRSQWCCFVIDVISDYQVEIHNPLHMAKYSHNISTPFKDVPSSSITDTSFNYVLLHPEAHYHRCQCELPTQHETNHSISHSGPRQSPIKPLLKTPQKAIVRGVTSTPMYNPITGDNRRMDMDMPALLLSDVKAPQGDSNANNAPLKSTLVKGQITKSSHSKSISFDPLQYQKRHDGHFEIQDINNPHALPVPVAGSTAADASALISSHTTKLTALSSVAKSEQLLNNSTDSINTNQIMSTNISLDESFSGHQHSDSFIQDEMNTTNDLFKFDIDEYVPNGRIADNDDIMNSSYSNFDLDSSLLVTENDPQPHIETLDGLPLPQPHKVLPPAISFPFDKKKLESNYDDESSEEEMILGDLNDEQDESKKGQQSVYELADRPATPVRVRQRSRRDTPLRSQVSVEHDSFDTKDSPQSPTADEAYNVAAKTQYPHLESQQGDVPSTPLYKKQKIRPPAYHNEKPSTVSQSNKSNEVTDDIFENTIKKPHSASQRRSFFDYISESFAPLFGGSGVLDINKKLSSNPIPRKLVTTTDSATTTNINNINTASSAIKFTYSAPLSFGSDSDLDPLLADTPQKDNRSSNKMHNDSDFSDSDSDIYTKPPMRSQTHQNKMIIDDESELEESTVPVTNNPTQNKIEQFLQQQKAREAAMQPLENVDDPIFDENGEPIDEYDIGMPAEGEKCEADDILNMLSESLISGESVAEGEFGLPNIFGEGEYSQFNPTEVESFGFAEGEDLLTSLISEGEFHSSLLHTLLDEVSSIEEQSDELLLAPDLEINPVDDSFNELTPIDLDEDERDVDGMIASLEQAESLSLIAEGESHVEIDIFSAEGEITRVFDLLAEGEHIFSSEGENFPFFRTAEGEGFAFTLGENDAEIPDFFPFEGEQDDIDHDFAEAIEDNISPVEKQMLLFGQLSNMSHMDDNDQYSAIVDDNSNTMNDLSDAQSTDSTVLPSTLLHTIEQSDEEQYDLLNTSIRSETPLDSVSLPPTVVPVEFDDEEDDESSTHMYELDDIFGDVGKDIADQEEDQDDDTQHNKSLNGFDLDDLFDGLGDNQLNNIEEGEDYDDEQKEQNMIDHLNTSQLNTSFGFAGIMSLLVSPISSIRKSFNASTLETVITSPIIPIQSIKDGKSTVIDQNEFTTTPLKIRKVKKGKSFISDEFSLTPIKSTRVSITHDSEFEEDSLTLFDSQHNVQNESEDEIVEPSIKKARHSFKNKNIDNSDDEQFVQLAVVDPLSPLNGTIPSDSTNTAKKRKSVIQFIKQTKHIDNITDVVEFDATEAVIFSPQKIPQITMHDNADEEQEEEQMLETKPKRAVRGRKATKKTINEDIPQENDEEQSLVSEKPKRGKIAEPVMIEDDDQDEITGEEKPKRTTRAGRKIAAKRVEEIETSSRYDQSEVEDIDLSEQKIPVKRGRRTANKKVEEEPIIEESVLEEEKPKRGRRTANKKVEEEPIIEEPILIEEEKPKRGRRTANKKVEEPVVFEQPVVEIEEKPKRAIRARQANIEEEVQPVMNVDENLFDEPDVPVRRGRRTANKKFDEEIEEKIQEKSKRVTRSRKAAQAVEVEVQPVEASQIIEDETPAPVKRGRRTANKKVEEEPIIEESVLEEEKPKRGRRTANKKVEEEPIIEEPILIEEEKPKRGRRTANKKAEEEPIIEESVLEEEKPKRGRRTANKKVEEEPIIEEPVLIEDEKPRRGRRTANKKVESDHEEPQIEEEKPKRGRRTANKKVESDLEEPVLIEDEKPKRGRRTANKKVESDLEEPVLIEEEKPRRGRRTANKKVESEFEDIIPEEKPKRSRKVTAVVESEIEEDVVEQKPKRVTRSRRNL